jgi:hypothetical protein
MAAIRIGRLLAPANAQKAGITADQFDEGPAPLIVVSESERRDSQLVGKRKVAENTHRLSPFGQSRGHDKS